MTDNGNRFYGIGLDGPATEVLAALPADVRTEADRLLAGRYPEWADASDAMRRVAELLEAPETALERLLRPSELLTGYRGRDGR